MSYISGYSASSERVRHDTYQMQINQTNDESVASTRRMLAQLDNANATATDTMANLDDQRQQLSRIDRNMTAIDVEVREAQRNLTALEKFCGLCTCPCRKPSQLKVIHLNTSTHLHVHNHHLLIDCRVFSRISR